MRKKVRKFSGEEDCLKEYRGGLLSYKEYQDCLKRYQTPLRIERRPDTDLFHPKVRERIKVLDSLLLRGPNEFLSSIRNQLTRRELSPKQEAAVRKWLRDPKELELFGGPSVSGEPDPELDLALQETRGHGSRSPSRQRADRLNVLEALISRKPNDPFIRSVRDQVALGKSLSDRQMAVIRKILHQVGMDYEGDVFRTASSVGRGTIKPNNEVAMINRSALRKILAFEGLSELGDYTPVMASPRKRREPRGVRYYIDFALSALGAGAPSAAAEAMEKASDLLENPDIRFDRIITKLNGYDPTSADPDIKALLKEWSA